MYLCMQPGVASVYCTIVQQSLNGSEFYIREFKELTGMTFGAARRCFDGVIVVGYMRKSEQQPLKLNPGDEDILKEGDKIVALADTGSLILLSLFCSRTCMQIAYCIA